MPNPGGRWGARSLAALALGVFLAAPAVAAKAKVFPAKGVKLSDYKTYHWEPIRVVTRQGVLEDDPEFAPMIKEAIRKQLAKKGYREVPSNGELKLLAAGLAEASSQLEGFLLRWGYDVYWGYGVAVATPVTRVNKAGTIVVNFVDAESGDGVWFGYATQALVTGGNVKRTIEKAVGKLFKKVPRRKD